MEGFSISRSELDKLGAKALRDILKSKKLPVSGRKKVLIDRIIQNSSRFQIDSTGGDFEMASQSRFFPAAHSTDQQAKVFSSGIVQVNQGSIGGAEIQQPASQHDVRGRQQSDNGCEDQQMPGHNGSNGQHVQQGQNHRPPDGSTNGEQQQNQVGSNQSAAPMDFTCQQDGRISMHIFPSNAIHQNNDNNGWLLNGQAVSSGNSFQANQPRPALASTSNNEWLIRDSHKLAQAIHDGPVNNNGWLSNRPAQSRSNMHVRNNAVHDTQTVASTAAAAAVNNNPWLSHASVAVPPHVVHFSSPPHDTRRPPSPIMDLHQSRISPQLTEPNWHSSTYVVGGTTPNIESDYAMSRRQELDYAIAESIEASKMPLEEPSVFQGDLLKYNRWAKSFDAFISKRKWPTASSKLFYLEKYTDGDARELIEHYLTRNSEQAYIEAWKDLNQTYGNSYLIAQAYKKKLFTWPKITNRDNVGIKKLANFLKQCLAMREENPHFGFLEECDRNQDIVKNLPDYMALRWNNKVTEYQLSHDQVFPPFSRFVEFMVFESHSANNPVTSQNALKSVSNVESSAKSDQSKPKSKSNQSAVSHKTDAESDSSKKKCCPHCKSDNHMYMSKCADFKSLSVEQRFSTVKTLKACNRCLSADHYLAKCTRDWKCGVCKSSSHHTLLHRAKGGPSGETTPPKAVSQLLNSTCTDTITDAQSRLFCKTVPVWISTSHNPRKEFLTYALLDDQSNKTYVTSRMLNKIGVEKEKSTLKISTMTSVDKKVHCDSTPSLRIRGFYSSDRIQLPRTYARSTIPCAISDIPTYENISGIQHLSGISKYIPPQQKCEVGLLIGRDCFDAMAPVGDVIPAPPGGACAMKTKLGWCVVGPDSRQASNISDEIGYSHNIYTLEDAMNPVSNIQSPKLAISCKTEVSDITPYELMNMIDGCEFVDHTDSQSISQDDVKFLKILDDGIHQDSSGYYVMPLPFKHDETTLKSSKQPVLKRFYGLLSQFKRRSADFRQKYTEFVEGIISRGEAELVPKSELESREGWFLPHHGVYHKKTGKIRVVFDCGAQANGVNLNDELLQGPDLNNSLLGVLLRFRQKPVALSCDIEKMYHRFKVVKEHRDYLRFFWLDDQGNPAVYRMCVHIFGARSSPNCAKYGLNRLATDYGENYPLAKEFIQRNFYVDDGLCSVNTSDEAIELLSQTRSLCKNGNLHVHKLLSNQTQVLEAFPQEDTNLKPQANIQLLDSTERALGMLWALDSDSFTYKYQPVPAKKITRRSVLANVASVYDPMGLISPLILPARVMIQNSCKDGLSWDQELDQNMCDKWKIWDFEISKISSLSIPRCIHPHTFMPVKQEIHTFADASEQGYGACSYVRSFDKNNTVHCSLMLGKTRVAPLKKRITIPRLELQAALLAAKQCISLKTELGMQCDSYLWSDSKIVLGYINNDSKRFQTFVANRVTQINEISSKSQWDYVNTSKNPADIASRGSSTVEYLNNSIWFHGPDFLWKTDPLPSSNCSFTVDPDDSELKKSAVTLATDSKSLSGFDEIVLSLVNKSSSWNKTVRCVAMLQNIKSNHSFDGCGKLSAQHTQNASNYIISLVQSISYQNEIQSLQSGCAIDKSSSLWRLDCFIDSDNLLRVGGRVKLSSLSLEDKHPIVIPKQSNLSKQILQHYHEQVAHQGRTSTMSAVRSAGFWVVGLSNAVSSLIYTCSFCRRLRRPVESQKMADLPPERVEVVPPFTHVGCDVFGPFPIKDGRKHMKKYGLIITCLSSRAVHIETLDNLSTDCFLQSWRCFVALRGNVSSVRCDNGTNFVGANNEILKLYDEMSQDSSFSKYLQEHHCEFIFNTPHASHMGGCWERMIRTIRSVFNGLTPHMHNFSSTSLRTLLYECMAIINSRPLTVVSSDCKPLSPNDLLHMKSSVILPMPGYFDDSDVYARKRWRAVQLLANKFWNRWRKEYVQNLQQRQKWVKSRRNLAINDIVILSDECGRRFWKLGRITEVLPSVDNLVRSVKVLCYDVISNKHSTFTRPVNKLVCLVESDAQY